MNIKTQDYNGKITEIEVELDIYEFDKDNFWQEDWRDRKSKQQNSIDDFCAELTSVSSEDEYIKKSEIDELFKAIDQLSEIQRNRIILHYFYGLKFFQISKLENVSARNIKRSVKLALENLNKILAKFKG
ncbi:hypothetical protein FACS189465_2920 [Clostridia bacterium]|nr:hypothetical protein FACS189465_2920 [Clostridia bacterium]